MKFFIFSISTILLITTHAFADENLKKEICDAFATEYSNQGDDYQYDYKAIHRYCMKKIKPEKVSGTSYYEVQLAVCGEVDQLNSFSYDTDAKFLEDIGGSGRVEECPYSSNEEE